MACDVSELQDPRPSNTLQEVAHWPTYAAAYDTPNSSPPPMIGEDAAAYACQDWGRIASGDGSDWMVEVECVADAADPFWKYEALNGLTATTPCKAGGSNIFVYE